MQRDSVEYLKFTLADRDNQSLSADSVQVALSSTYPPSNLTWLACTYDSGTTWRTSTPVTWSTTNYPDSRYRVYVKVTDFPETPLCSLGTVVIQ